MAVFIAVRQDKRKQSNNLWYGRTYNPNIIDTHGLAQRIQANFFGAKILHFRP